MEDYTALRAHLQTRLNILANRADRIEADLRTPGDRDWPDRAIELENAEVLEGLDELTLGEVKELREAIDRIDRGVYGRCTRCGADIGAARLAALPATGTCARCASLGS